MDFFQYWEILTDAGHIVLPTDIVAYLRLSHLFLPSFAALGKPIGDDPAERISALLIGDHFQTLIKECCDQQVTRLGFHDAAGPR